MNEILLDVKNVKKYFQVKGKMFSSSESTVHAVDDISFEVFKGETFGLVGESGCGKSTLSRTLLRLIEADFGSIIFDGKDILNMNKKELQKQREKMRMVFQKPFGSLNPRETVKEIISAPLTVHKSIPKSEIENEVLRLMNLVGLNSEQLNRYPHEFSGGQRQRIGIARALASNPKLIICDEPVSALDVSIQSQILNLLKDLQDQFGLTYLFISHNLSVVKYMSDRIAVMYLGVIVELADSKELYENALHPYTKALLSAIPEANTEQKKKRIILNGDIPSPVNPPAGCRFCTRCSFSMDICKTQRPTLKEIDARHYIACFLYEKDGEVK
ncbi:MAG: dipeptide ABC transporter ATP-binding protein [Clostridium beijerinckii]